MDVGKRPAGLDETDAAERTSRFAALIESCRVVSTREDFLLHVYARLKMIVPHDRFACGIGTIDDMTLRHCINLDFPEEYIHRVIAPSGRMRSAVLRRWAHAMPQYYNGLAVERGDVDPDLKSAVLEYGLPNAGVHCYVDDRYRTVSFFCFAGMLGGPRRFAVALYAIVPHLHGALASMLRRDGLRGGVMLSSRECEVLRWICLGKSNPEMALILGISPWTVKIHVRNVLEKLGVKTRSAAAAKALHAGLVKID